VGRFNFLEKKKLFKKISICRISKSIHRFVFCLCILNFEYLSFYQNGIHAYTFGIELLGLLAFNLYSYV